MSEQLPPAPAPAPPSSTSAPPLPPSLGSTSSSPTWAADSNHTWGGPSVLLTAGWAGEIIDIARLSPQHPPTSNQRDVAARFEQLLLLGKGGMGEVWRVRDVDLNRVVAMKIVRLSGGISEPLFARFVAEAQATAQLEHPGIVPVYELGRLPDGRIYYTMQEIKGRNLAAVLSDLHADSTPAAFASPTTGWTFLRVMEAFRQVCDTIAFAHARGVIHRDLKPANIMLGAFGEVRVVDWGLVKVLDRTGQSSGADRGSSPSSPLSISSGDSSGPATSAGAVAGTRGYMAPEQAQGEIDRLSPATDVYALGGILFAILAGRPPDDRSGLHEVLSALPRAPVALREVCARAMAPAPADRYADARGLASAVSQWLERATEAEQSRAQIERIDEAFAASPEPLQAELREILLRLHGRGGRPISRPLAELQGPALDLLVNSGVVSVQNNSVSISNPDLLQRWDRLAGWLDAERDKLPLRQGLHDQALAWEGHGRAGDLLWKGEQLAELEAWLRQRSPRLSASERAFAEACAVDQRVAVQRRRVGLATLILLLSMGLIFTVIQERRTREALDLAEAARLAERQALTVAEGRALGAEAALSVISREPHRALALGMAAAEMIPEDQHVALRLAMLSVSTDPLQVFAGHSGFVYHSEWLGGQRFVTSGIDKTLRLWDASTGQQLQQWSTDSAPVTIAVSPDGTRLSAILESGVFELWDLERGEQIARTPAHEGFGIWTEFSPDGSLVVTAGSDAGARVWDGRTGEPIRTLTTDGSLANSVTFAPTGERILAWQRSPTVFDARTGETLFQVPDGHTDDQAAISPDGGVIATASPRGEIMLWDVETGQRRWATSPRKAIQAPLIAISRDGEQVFMAYGDGELLALNSADGQARARIQSGVGAARQLELSADGEHLTIVGTQGGVGLFQTGLLAKIGELHDPSGQISVNRFSPDGRAILMASEGGTARVWRPRALEAQDATRCGGLQGEFNADSANGAWLAYSSSEGLCVRPIEEDRPVEPLRGLPLRAVAIIGDGSRVVAKGEPGDLSMLDTSTGQALWQIRLEGDVLAAGFSATERALVVQLPDKRLRFLDAATGEVRGVTQPAEYTFMYTALQDLVNQSVVPVMTNDGVLYLYDGDSGAELRSLPQGTANMFGLFAERALEDGRRVAMGDALGTLRVYDLSQEAPDLELKLGDAPLLAVATSHAGAQIAAADAEGVISLVDTAQKKVRKIMETGDKGIYRLVFSPDETLLVSASRTGELAVWDATTGAPVWRSNLGGSLGAAGCVLDSGRLLAWSERTMRTYEIHPTAPGARTNLRACEGSTEVVAVQPFPADDAVWAPAALCTGSGGS